MRESQTGNVKMSGNYASNAAMHTSITVKHQPGSPQGGNRWLAFKLQQIATITQGDNLLQLWDDLRLHRNVAC